MKQTKEAVNYHMIYRRWEGTSLIRYSFRRLSSNVPEVKGIWLRFGGNDSLNINNLVDYHVYRVNDDDSETLILEGGDDLAAQTPEAD